MGYPCGRCCSLDCGRCQFVDRPTTFIADLGAGGWVDERCDFCDQFTGEFLLPKFIRISGELPCEWAWDNVDLTCPFPSSTSSPPQGANAQVLLEYWGDPFPATAWRWRLQVNYAGAAASHARFETTDTNDPDCWHFGGESSSNKITLMKVLETHTHLGSTQDSCSGALSTALTAWRA